MKIINFIKAVLIFAMLFSTLGYVIWNLIDYSNNYYKYLMYFISGVFSFEIASIILKINNES